MTKRDLCPVLAWTLYDVLQWQIDRLDSNPYAADSERLKKTSEYLGRPPSEMGFNTALPVPRQCIQEN